MPRGGGPGAHRVAAAHENIVRAGTCAGAPWRTRAPSPAADALRAADDPRSADALVRRNDRSAWCPV